MEVLSGVFQQHPSALRLHRNLVISLARGDAESAADLAAALAQQVQRVLRSNTEASEAVVEAAASTAESPAVNASGEVGQDQPPTALAEDVEEAIGKAREAALQSLSPDDLVSMTPAEDSRNDSGDSSSPPTVTETNSSSANDVPFWQSSESLSITLLESAFETVLPGDEDGAHPLSEAGRRAAEHEAQQVAILEQYLTNEADRWKAQKNAVAKTVLDVARTLQLTPADLQAGEGAGKTGTATSESAEAPQSSSRLNVLKHFNLVVRGEVPEVVVADADAASDAVAEELAVLKERMVQMNTPLSPQEEAMARYELLMSATRMRYVVGVHRDLQLALEHSAGLQRAMKAAGVPASTSASTFFVDEVMKALHRDPDTLTAVNRAAALAEEKGQGVGQQTAVSVAEVEAVRALATPVLPFTFLLKCCLWFDIPAL